MDEEDTSRLVPESAANLWKVVREKTDLQRFGSGIKIACICLALVLSAYSIVLIRQLKIPLHNEDDKIFDLHEELDPMEDWFLDLSPKIENILSRMEINFPVVDCFRNQTLRTRGVITYNGCFIDTSNGSMNIQTGIFTTKQAGIYQISFSTKYVASSAGQFGAWSDICINNKVVADIQREFNDDGFEKETSTHSAMVYHLLNAGDKVKVKFNKDGSSYIHSDSDHDVHFTIRMVSLPPSTISPVTSVT